MFPVPEYQLKKLHCATCPNYLTHKPIMANNRNKQICGKCFEQLSPTDRSAYVRQVAFEAIAENLIFPCVHHAQGCAFTYNWYDGAVAHELTCPFRDATLPLDRARNQRIVSMRKERPKSESTATLLRQQSPPPNATFIGWNRIRNKNSYKLKAGDSNSNRESSDEAAYCSIYGDYQSVLTECSNCKSQLQPLNTTNHCLYGHSTCATCKGDLCQKCDRVVLKEKGFRCFNHKYGCKALLARDEVKGHEADCVFKKYKCPIFSCSFFDSLKALHHHFVVAHKDSCIFGAKKTVHCGRKDMKLYFWCFESLFYFKFYFNGLNEMQFLIEYIGSHADAIGFSYRIECLGDGIALDPKTADCMGWNSNSLDKGVVYEIPYDYRNAFKTHITITRKK